VSPRPSPFLTPGSALRPTPLALPCFLHTLPSPLAACKWTACDRATASCAPAVYSQLAVRPLSTPSHTLLCQCAICRKCPCSRACANSLNTHTHTHDGASREEDDERGEDKGLSGAGKWTRGGRCTSPRPPPDLASSPDHAPDDLSPEARFVHHVRPTTYPHRTHILPSSTTLALSIT